MVRARCTSIIHCSVSSSITLLACLSCKSLRYTAPILDVEDDYNTGLFRVADAALNLSLVRFRLWNPAKSCRNTFFIRDPPCGSP